MVAEQAVGGARRVMVRCHTCGCPLPLQSAEVTVGMLEFECFICGHTTTVMQPKPAEHGE